MTQKAYRLKRRLLSFLYPNRCPFCDSVISAVDYYCDDCEKPDKFNDSSDITAYCVYDDESKKTVYKAKEGGNGYAMSAAAYLLYRKLLSEGLLEKIDLIVAVPARKESLKKRGYCFPRLMAKEIAVLASKRFSDKCLIRIRESEEQKGLNGAERVLNVKDAFAIGKQQARGLNVLVIDDVSTTGSTLFEARRILKDGGAINVFCAAFASTESVRTDR